MKKRRSKMYNIMFCCNDAVYKGLLLASLSYCKYNDEAVTFHVLTMSLPELNPNYVSLTEEHRQKLEEILQKKNKDSKVLLYDCRDAYLEALEGSENNLSAYTPYTMLRLLADKYIQLDKILYIDTDVMIHKSLEGLFNIDLKDYEYAGVRDYLGRVFINPRYINAGVLLLNLKRIRETKLFEKCLNALKTKKYGFPDQTVLNKFALKKMFLPNIYNMQHGFKEKCVIRHFCKTILWRPFYVVNIKQWDIERVHKTLHIHAFDDIYEEYNQIISQ